MRFGNTTAAVLAALALGCGGGGGGTGPAAPPPPVDPSRASFTLQGAGYNNAVSNLSNAGGNLIFCRQEPPGPNTIWIRMAQSSAANGENSPHIDIDLCNFAGTANYTVPHDTAGDRTCSQGATFAVWWHDGAREFASRPDTSPCSVSVTRGTGTIEGTFECLGVPPHTGTGDHLDVRAGSFRCNF
jgi:hypothetical protein